MKDLFKPGRKLGDYVKKDGTPVIHCISCGRRPKIGTFRIGYLCGDDKRYHKCNTFPGEFKLWTPRVNYDTLIKDEDFEL